MKVISLSDTAKRIPIRCAEKVAKDYGYDQVVIYARKVGSPGGEHMTTYGVTKIHCGVAARIGKTLQRFMGWNVTVDESASIGVSDA